MTQQPSAVPTASAPGQALMDAEFPTDTKLVQTIKAFAEVGEGQESEQVASKPEVEKIEAYENVYKGQAKSVPANPANLAEATLEARRACQKAQPACSISFTTKRTVREGTWTAYKMWGACAECKPRCSLRAIWIDGPAEGRVIVDCRGHHERKAVAAGGRLLPANVQNVVNEVIESGAPITTRSLREAVAREDLQFDCEPQQLHNMVKRLRQTRGTASSSKKVPIQAFLDEAKRWESDLPKDLGAGEDLSRLMVLRSPHGAIMEAGQVYVPVACPGMLL